MNINLKCITLRPDTERIFCGCVHQLNSMAARETPAPRPQHSALSFNYSCLTKFDTFFYRFLRTVLLPRFCKKIEVLGFL